jgi:hypothetical protein
LNNCSFHRNWNVVFMATWHVYVGVIESGSKTENRVFESRRTLNIGILPMYVHIAMMLLRTKHLLLL